MTRAFVIAAATAAGRWIDLCDLLKCLPSAADHLVWRVDVTECVGPSAPDLDAITASSEPVSTATLRALADGIDQSIDAVFIGAEPSTSHARVYLRAVDGCAWDVATDDQDIAAAVAGAFADSREEDAGELFGGSPAQPLWILLDRR